MLRRIFESYVIKALLRLWQRDSWRIEFLDLLKELYHRSECAETVDIRNFRTFVYLSQRLLLRDSKLRASFSGDIASLSHDGRHFFHFLAMPRTVTGSSAKNRHK